MKSTSTLSPALLGRPQKNIAAYWRTLCCTALLLLGLTAHAKNAPAGDYLLPDGTLNVAAILGQSLTLDLAGWDIALTPGRGPVFSPAPPPSGTWNALNQGLNERVFCMAVIGTDIYVGGYFTGVESGTPVAGLNNIAKWDGTSWSALDKGLNDDVFALEVVGTDLYVGGGFTGVGDGGTWVHFLNYAAKWNGSAWSAMGEGLNNQVWSLKSIGSDLYVGGFFTDVKFTPSVSGLKFIAKWNGSAWSALDKGLNHVVYSLEMNGNDLYAGGTFTGVGAGGTPVQGLNKVAKWNGSAWSALNTGLNNQVSALKVLGVYLYAGGNFTDVGAGGTPVSGLNYVAKWDGSTWSALNSGLSGTNGGVLDFEVIGSELYVCGFFSGVGGGTPITGLNNIAKWNGSTWLALDQGLNSFGLSMAVSGTDLYVGGNFIEVGSGGTPVTGMNKIAKWGPPCPDLTSAPSGVTITNSTCNGDCTPSGGSFAAPACPTGSTPQYSTDGGANWSGTLPTYAQSGPAQAVRTRCSCTTTTTTVSPASADATTVPGTCTTAAYTISTAGNVLTVTDAVGNVDVLTVTEDGTGIQFATTPARTYSLNGGPATCFPVTIPNLASFISATINTAGGTDEVSITGFTVAMPNFTVNGGAGDLTFTGNLINNSASARSLALNSDANITLRQGASGGMPINTTVVATGNVTINQLGYKTNGGTFSSSGVNITVQANGMNTSRNGAPGGNVNFTHTGNVQIEDSGIQTGGGIFSSSGVYITVEGSGMNTSRTNEPGGNVILTPTGNVRIQGAGMQTGGGSFSSTGTDITIRGLNTSRSGFTGGSVMLTPTGNVLIDQAGLNTGGGSFSSTGGVNLTIKDGGANTSRSGFTGGNVMLTPTGNVLINGVQTGGGSFSSTGVAFEVDGSGLYTSFSGGAGGNVTLTPTGVVQIKSIGIVTGGGNVSSSGTNLTITNSGMNTSLFGGAGGSVTLTPTGDVLIEQVGVQTGGGNFSSSGIAFTITGSGLNTSRSGFAGGGVTLTPTGNVMINGVQTGGGHYSSSGIAFTITGGGVNTSRNGFAGGNITLTPTGNVQIESGGVQTGGGNFSSSGIAFTITGGGMTTSRNGFTGGNITLTPTGNVLIEQSGAQTGGGNFSSTGGVDITIKGGGLNATTLGGTGTVTINHTGNALLPPGGGIQANGNISITASTLGISSAEINTTGGTVVLNTPNGTSPTFISTDVTGTGLSFVAGSKLNIVVNGTTQGDGMGSTYTQLKVVGTVNLTGTTLMLSGTHVPALAHTFTLINNDGTDAITGTFNGLAEGAYVNAAPFSSLFAKISYMGGDGNDAVLTVVAADYTITSGADLTITDDAGNGDVLDVTPDGTGINFATSPQRTYALNGGATMFFPVTIASVANFNNIAINTEEGDDTNNIGAFTAALNKLTINGGTGGDAVNFNGDITFASNADLDVDLQNDDATPGTDVVTVAANANLILSGTGSATVKVSKNVLINSGGSIETANGDLTVEANQQAVPTSGNFKGVELNGGILDVSGSGNLNVKGEGGSTGNDQVGIRVLNGGQIQSGNSTVIVEGTGGATTGGSTHGVLVENANSRIASSGGNVSVTGFGGGIGASSSFNFGVIVLLAGEIMAGGSGTVTVLGTGGTTSGNGNYGVLVDKTSSRINSSGGDVSVTGFGGGTGATSQNHGVVVNSAGQITAGSNGKVKVQGVGTATSGNSNYGVWLLNANSIITSAGGDVSVTGTGGGSGASTTNHGVYVASGSKITAGVSGIVTVQGTGGTTTGLRNYGVYVESANSSITSSGGNVNVTGVGNGTGAGSNRSHGVFVNTSGAISAGGMGAVTVNGTGGQGAGGANFGVVGAGSGQITSSGGPVTVVGNGGVGSTGSMGVLFQANATITSGGNGNVHVTGTSNGTLGNGNVGVNVNSFIGASGTGSTTVIGFGGAGTGTDNIGVRVVPSGNPTAMITSAGGPVIVEGTGGGTGASSFNSGVACGNGEISAGGGGSVTIMGTGGTGTGGFNFGVLLNNAATKIFTANGSIDITGLGGAGTTGGGVALGNGAVIEAGGTGTVQVLGTGGSTGPLTRGVSVETGAEISSTNGNVTVTGIAGGTGSSASNTGIAIVSDALSISSIHAGGTGTVTLNGTGGATSGDINFGVLVGTNSSVFTENGPVNIIGQGGGTGASNGNAGVVLQNGGKVTAGGSHDVNIHGTGGNSSGAGNVGVVVQNSGTEVASSGGDLHITGVEGTGSTPFGIGTFLTASVTTAAAGGDIFFTANSMKIEAPVSTDASSSVTLKPLDNGVAIDLGTATDPAGGPLGLTDAELDLITTGTLNIGDANTGDITVSTDITRPASTVINLTTGDEVNFEASALNSAGGNINIDAVNGTNPSATGTDVNTGAGSTLDFAVGDKLNIAINGNTVDAQYRQLKVEGKVDITGLDLVFSGAYTPLECEAYIIVNNDGSDAIVGIFTGLAEGATFSNFRGSGLNAKISYVGGDGNDVVVKVTDVTPPTITCPNNRTVNTDPNQCSSVQTYTVIASDNCAFTTTQTAGLPSSSAFPLNITTNGFTVTDGAGLTATCSFSITVVDNQPPVINCPSNIVQSAPLNQCNAVVTYTVTASDNCTSTTSTQTSGLPSGSVFPIGTSAVTWLTTDITGNTTACAFSITVVDSQKPSIVCPSNMTKVADIGQCTATTIYPTPNFSDNCPGAYLTRTSGLASGAAFPVGTHSVNWQATDAGGNTAICNFTVTVSDTQMPSITCPANVVKNTDVGQCTAVVTYANPTATDNCSGVSAVRTSGLASGSAFTKGATQVMWQATDGVGLTKTCAFTVTVNDAQAPTIACPGNQVRSTDAGFCTAVVSYTMPTFTDNCAGGSVAIQSGLASGSAFPRGITTVVWKATDDVGLTKTCTFRVTVNDTQAPTFTICPSSQSVNTDAGLCTAAVTYATPTAIDNCTATPTVLKQSGLASGSNFPKGTSAVVWKATDGVGLTKICSFTVTVTDAQLPTITCPANIAVTTAPGQCNAVVTYANPSASDNCSSPTAFLLSGLASGASYSQGVTTNVWKATDNSGTSNTCAFTVTVSCGATSEQLAVRSEQFEVPTTDTRQPITMTLTPNPATTQVLVTVEGLGENGGDLSVFDAQGRVVWQQHNVLNSTANINIADLPSGLYFVTLHSAGAVATKRLVKAQ